MSVSSAPLPAKVNVGYFSWLAKLPYSRQQTETFGLLPLCDHEIFSATSVTGEAVAIHAPMCSPGLCLRGYVATTTDSSRSAAEFWDSGIHVRNLRRSFDCHCAGAASERPHLNTEHVCAATVSTLFWLNLRRDAEATVVFLPSWRVKKRKEKKEKKKTDKKNHRANRSTSLFKMISPVVLCNLMKVVVIKVLEASSVGFFYLFFLFLDYNLENTAF